MKKRGAPKKYETQVKSRFQEIEEWLKLGITEKEIYTNLKICKDTWIKYKKENIELIDLIKNSRKAPVIQIKKAMLDRAIGFRYEEKKVITQKIKLPAEAEEILVENGYSFDTSPRVVKTEVITKQALPDPTAGLILLQHWDLDENGKAKWSRDLSLKELKEKELELKEKKIEGENW